MPDPPNSTRTGRPTDGEAAPTSNLSDPNATTVPFVTSPETPTASQPAERYVLGEEIAGGGMGVVLRATDTVLNREIAIKRLHEKYVGGSDAARRFVAEARITGRLQHPVIPRCTTWASCRTAARFWP